MKRLKLCTAICLALYSCQPDNGHVSLEPWYADARHCADSCRVFLPRLTAIYDSLLQINEWEALKIKNNYEMTRQNLTHLELMLDSLEQSPLRDNEMRGYKAHVISQTQYLYSLLTSGNAILSNHSQSFGRWQSAPEGIPDSILSPVKKVN